MSENNKSNKVKMAWLKTTPYGMWSKEFNAAELADLFTSILSMNDGGRISIRSVKDVNKTDGSEFESHVLEFIPAKQLKAQMLKKGVNGSAKTSNPTQFAEQDF